MKLKNGFVLKKENGQNIIVCTDKTISFDNIIMLNETNALLFERLSEGPRTKEELLNLLLDEFDISTILALNDIDVFIKTLKQNGVIEE
ncbi:MAG: PqqD family protein [Clostridia bacterium]|nr:PqqD family protein [Clostridia bacterium]